MVQGEILDVAIDLRRCSPHFVRHVAIELTPDEGAVLYIPVGFGYGFAALAHTAEVSYMMTDFYCQTGDQRICWNDPDFAIPWPVGPQNEMMSEKDRRGSTLVAAEVLL